MDHSTPRREEGRRRVEAAVWVLLCGGAFVVLCAAIPQDGRTLDGFLVQLLAALTGYVAVRRWLASPDLRDTVRCSWLSRYAGPIATGSLTLFLVGAVLFPAFSRTHCVFVNRLTDGRGIAWAFTSLLEDAPDGRVPHISSRAEAEKVMGPYLHSSLRGAKLWKRPSPEGDWVFNPQVSGKSRAELSRDREAPVLAWSESWQESDSSGDACRPVIRLSGPDCLSAAEWGRVRPRW